MSNADGTGNVRLNATLAAEGDVLSMQWAPSGDRLAYVADPVTAGVTQLFTVDAAGGTPQLVSDELFDIGTITFK